VIYIFFDNLARRFGKNLAANKGTEGAQPAGQT
jgi:hypothetical protein